MEHIENYDLQSFINNILNSAEKLGTKKGREESVTEDHIFTKQYNPVLHITVCNRYI